jgi:phage tail-like protein
VSSAIGQSEALKQGFRFRVTIGESNVGAPEAYSPRDARFSRISGIQGALNVVEAPSGAQGAPEKFPTGLAFQDITLQRGQVNNLDLLEWFNEAALSGSGLLSGGRYKRNVVITELDREGLPINRWVLVDAFPSDYRVGPYDANSNAFLIVRLTLSYRGFFIQRLSSSRIPARPGADIMDVFLTREDERQSRYRQVETTE